MQDPLAAQERRISPHRDELEDRAFEVWLQRSLQATYGPPDDTKLPEALSKLLETA